MSLTDEKLAEWTALPDHQMTLKRLADLGISVNDIAAADLDGLAPGHAGEVLGLPQVQHAIDRLSRARLAAAVDRMTARVEAVAALLHAQAAARCAPQIVPDPLPAKAGKSKA